VLLVQVLTVAESSASPEAESTIQGIVCRASFEEYRSAAIQSHLRLEAFHDTRRAGFPSVDPIRGVCQVIAHYAVLEIERERMKMFAVKVYFRNGS
jgi:hypothetical protein